jgi:ketosteroid isomerase-like protein
VVVIAIGAAAAAYLSGQLNPPPQDPMTIARPQIEAAMAEYRSAYRNRNLGGVVEVFPELPADTRREMQQAFADCLVYEVVFADMQVALDPADPNSAQVDVRSTHTCTPTSGGRQTNTSHHDVFSLKKIGDEWLIAGSAPVSAGGPQ